MAAPLAILLSSGGLRSLVATALAVSPAENAKVMLVHFKDRRSATAQRLEFTRRQAKHFHLSVLEVDPFTSPDLPTAAPPALPRMQLLLAAVAAAVDLGATTILWPIQLDGDYEAIARASEQLTLLQQLAELEHPHLPAIQTPLMDLTDRQVVEVGHRLKVPFPLAWSCQMNALVPCRGCPACRRRRTAFEALGLADPIEQAAMPSPSRT